MGQNQVSFIEWCPLFGGSFFRGLTAVHKTVVFMFGRGAHFVFFLLPLYFPLDTGFNEGMEERKEKRGDLTWT